MHAISVPKNGPAKVEATGGSRLRCLRQYVGSLNAYAVIFIALCGLAITIETCVTIVLVKCIAVLQSSPPAALQARRPDAEVWLRLLKERREARPSPAN